MKDAAIKFYAGSEDSITNHQKEQGAIYLVTDKSAPSLCMDVGAIRYTIENTAPEVRQINKEVQKIKEESFLEASNLDIDDILKTAFRG